MQKIAARMAGAAASIMECHFPDIYSANHEMGVDAEDVTFPPPALQKEGRALGAPCWFANQGIFRSIGREFGSPSECIEDARIALHVDESDEPCMQLLQFLPMGGRDGCGGPVDGTDLLVFNRQDGGKCIRIPTTIEDCVVLVAMNSARQLHGGVDESVPGSSPEFWSARHILYNRGVSFFHDSVNDPV